ncbi:MAG: hypothetical protein CMJ64_12450 [Planctomycetaceae bacterium]|nr:hypothetical protein [Planctomycetaceae bacterium]
MGVGLALHSGEGRRERDVAFGPLGDKVQFLFIITKVLQPANKGILAVIVGLTIRLDPRIVVTLGTLQIRPQH